MQRKLKRFNLRFRRLRRQKLPQNADELKTMSRHPHAVPIITFAVLIFLTAGIYFVARQTNQIKPHPEGFVVIVSHDHEKQVVPSRQQTVGTLLKKLGIRLGEGDVVEPATDAVIKQDDFRINVYRAVPVQVVNGSRKTFAFSAGTTPRAIAQQTGQKLYAEDLANTVPAQNFVQTGAIGEQVVIDRATPVNVDLYGAHVVIRTHAETVGDMMKEKHIVLTKKDRLSVPRSTPITPGLKVAFLRTGTKTETVKETIATPIKTINDNSLAYGTKAIRQKGSPGQQIVTYKVTLKNNVEIKRTAIQKVVTKKPVIQIVVVGTNLSGIKGDMALAGISPGDYGYVDFIFSHESGWNPAARSPYGYVGLGQTSLSNLSGACPNWETDPICQIRYFNGYASSHYGSWAGAAAAWRSNGGWW